MNLIAFLVFSLSILGLFALSEGLLRSLGLKPETTRKMAHVGSSIAVVLMPEFLFGWEIAIMASLFLLLLLVTKRFNLLRGIHGVARKTIGEFTFPLGVLLATIVLLDDHKQAFQIGFLVLGIADTMAEFGGKWKKLRAWKIMGQEKSLGGWISFAIATTLILIPYVEGLPPNTMLAILLVMPLALATLESVQVYGIDNLTLPTCTGLLWMWLV